MTVTAYSLDLHCWRTFLAFSTATPHWRSIPLIATTTNDGRRVLPGLGYHKGQQKSEVNGALRFNTTCQRQRPPVLQTLLYENVQLVQMMSLTYTQDHYLCILTFQTHKTFLLAKSSKSNLFLLLKIKENCNSIRFNTKGCYLLWKSVIDIDQVIVEQIALYRMHSRALSISGCEGNSHNCYVFD